MRNLVLWSLAAVFSVAITLFAFCPAAWMASLLESSTAGRLTLGDPQGTLWRGSAFIGGAPSGRDPVTPLLPGRFSWSLSPLLLLGQVDITLENPEALSQPIALTGSWTQWQLGPGSIMLPAERLAGLGAPLNTVAPAGQMRLSWGLMQLTRQEKHIDVNGRLTLDMNDIASRLSPIKPLGAYQMLMDWSGQDAQLNLTSVKGPLLLSGTGAIQGGRFQFSGKAEAEAGHEEKLGNLLNMLGQRRKVGDKYIIALEFRQ